MKLKILHINTWGGIGGAFIASNRLHRALLNVGINSVFAYGKTNPGLLTKDLSQYRIIQKNNRIEYFLTRLGKKFGLNDIGNISSFALKQQEYFDQTTVLNFHNLHDDYFSYLALSTLTQDQPAVWTLHDLWSFTGHCAYSYDCSRWKTGCGKCPYPNAEPAIRRDSTRLEWKLKNWIYSHSNLTIVTPSTWLTKQAKQSMLKRFSIHHIPNGIDTEDYQPLNSKQCRSLLGIPTSKKVLMFGAQRLEDFRKGGDLLLKILSSLPLALKAETVLLTLGNGGEAISDAVEMQSLDLGYVSSDRLKSIAYSAADLFIFPTRADNLPLVLQESMACGTPMVSFKVGGVPDLVRPGITGYLAQPEDAQDFSNGIVQLLEDKTLRKQMSQNCRAITLKEYSIKLQAQRYIDLYNKLQKT